MIAILMLLAAAATNPAELWKQADTLLQQHQYAEARRVLTQAVKADPNEPAFWFHLGVSCAELKDTGGAIAAFEKARALAPGRAEVYFSLGLQYWHRGDVGKAKETYEAGLRLDPKQPAALQNYALLLMKTGEPGKAITPLLTLKNIPELTLQARVALIECFLKSGDRLQAERETDDLLQSGIGTPADETQVAAILVEAGDRDTAEKVLRVSLSRQPDQAKACAALGVILMDKKQYQDASESLQRSVQLAPDSSEYALAFAESLELSNHEHELLEFLKQVEPKFSKLPEFQYKLALAYYRATELSSAVATLQKLLQMNPRRKDRIYFILGNSYLTIGNYAEAEKAYRNAIEMNPKDPSYYEEFATLLRKEGPGRVGDAIAELKHALQFDPSNPRLALQLALCYESKGDLNSAVTLAEEAVRGQPEMLPAHVALARIYFRLGRKSAGQKEKETIAQLEQKQQQSLLPNSDAPRSADVRAQ